MAGYAGRQQFYVDEDIILSEHTNDEFDQLVAAFDELTGHRHDGTAGGGAFISAIGDNDGDTKVSFDEIPDDDVINFYTSGTNRMTVSDLGITLGGRFNISYNAVDDTLDIGVI